MTRPDDSSLTAEEAAIVKHHADRLLRDASAYGRFPTPINDLMSAAKVTIVDDEILDEPMLRRIAERVRSTVSSGLATIKSAFSKVLGLFDARDRLVFLDKDLPTPRVPFVSLHEAGHGQLPHQTQMYALMHDCDQTLDDEIRDLFEKEANFFASEVLFQGDVFTEAANDMDFGVKAAKALAKQFGASNYSTFRRFAKINGHACCLIAVDTDVLIGAPASARRVRRIIASRSFEDRFDPNVLAATITHGHPLKSLLPYGQQKVVPLRTVQLVDRNGAKHEFLGEAFVPKQILILIRENAVRRHPGIIQP